MVIKQQIFGVKKSKLFSGDSQGWNTLFPQTHNVLTRLVCKPCVNDGVVTERFMRNVMRWTREICQSHQLLDLFFSLVALYTYGHPIVSTCRKQYICEAMQMQKGNQKGQEVNICLLLLEQS